MMICEADAIGGESARLGLPSTPAQRITARRLMHALHVSVDQITLAHRRFFVFANVEFPPVGGRMDDALDALSADAIARLIAEFDRAIAAAVRGAA